MINKVEIFILMIKEAVLSTLSGIGKNRCYG